MFQSVFKSVLIRLHRNFKKFSKSRCLLIYFVPTCMYIGHSCKNEETESGDSGGSGEAGDSQKSGHSDNLGEPDDSGDTYFFFQ